MMKFNLVVCGGTFDHFHKGHESLLKLAFSVGQKVIVGVTSDDFIRRWKIDGRSWKLLEPFEKRKGVVLEFAKKEEVLDRVEIVQIDDMFGSTLDKNLFINAIIVSEETKKGADIINQRRKGLDLVPLKILVDPSVYAEDRVIISSSRIRAGEINRNGKLYIKPAWLKTDLALPENLRQEFHKPFGELVEKIDQARRLISPFIITVGDETSKKFNENSIGQNISVVDFKVARKEKFTSFAELGFQGDEEVVMVNNPAGHITADLFLAIVKIFALNYPKRIILKVTGEEDLAVLPLILASPLNSVIYYGQPDTGLIKISVSEESKDRAYNLVSKLKST